MALITINNIAVLSGTIMMPLVGVWTADLVIDQPDGSGFDAGTSVTIACANGVTLSGTVALDRTGDFLDAVHVRVLGGAGGLGKQATPTCYTQPGAYVRDVVNGLVSDSGETLSDTADADFLGTNLTAWSVVQVPTAQALKTLIAIVQPGLSWRILSDGKLWIGSESWPASTVSYELIEAHPTMGTYDLGFESPTITPGINLAGVGQVNRVEHTIESNRIRSHVWVNMPNADTDRGIKGAIDAMVKSAMAGIDYFALYDAKVVSQSSDLASVDVQPIDPRLPGYGSVPLRHGLPGVKVQVAPGAILRLGWDRGNPSLPFAALWDGGETVTKIVLSATTVYIGAEGGANALPTKDDFDNHTHQAGTLTTAVGGGAVSGVSGAPVLPATGTTKLKAV